jgi:multidrug efflux system membrane fusion protein
VLSVEPTTVSEQTILTGVLEAYRSVDVVSEVAGPLEALYKDVGDRVPGQTLLASIEKKVARENLNQSEAALMAAAARFEVAREDAIRDSTLHAAGDISLAVCQASRMARQSAQADLKSARAARELGARQLAKTDIRAPFAGYVSRRHCDVGAYISRGMPLFRIVDIDSLRLVLNLSQSHVARVSPGHDVLVEVDALAGSAFHGRVRSVAPEADELTRTFPVELILANPAGHPLRGGLIVRATLVLQNLEGVIAIPREAVLRQGGHDFVFVAKDSLAQRREIRTGRAVGDRYLIEEGLEPGDALITSGMQNLHDGCAIQVEAENSRSGKEDR